MNTSTINILLISICTFATICLLVIVFIRTRKLMGDTKKINKRLEFWLSEKSNIERAILGEEIEKPDKEITFAQKVLLPLGEQVGTWMSDKVPYANKKSKRIGLIKAGIRGKKSLEIFYATKIVAAVIFGIIFFVIFSIQSSKLLLPITCFAAYVGFAFPGYYVSKLADGRRKLIDKVLPDALDLLVICTEAGMGIDQALLKVSANLTKSGKALQEEIILTNREMNLGQDRSLCWKNLGERTTSQELKNLAGIVLQTEKVGSQIAQVLRDQADFLRVRRRQKAEEEAAKMSVKMLIPMMFFIFPCILAITLGPPVMKIVSVFSATK